MAGSTIHKQALPSAEAGSVGEVGAEKVEVQSACRLGVDWHHMGQS